MTADRPVPRGFWHRRIKAPVIQQLTQGISAERIALTITLGLTLGIFPILGSTSLLSAITAWLMRLNQPIIQAVTLLTFPLQCLLLLPFYRAGDALFDVPAVPLSIPLIVSRFFEDTGKFFTDYGMTGVRGIIVWALLAPPAGAVVFFILRKTLRTMAVHLRLRIQ